MKNLKKSKKAFSFFELIITIVILGIVLSSFPGLFSSAVNANKISITNEIFFEEFSILSMITTRYFDENNTKSDNYYKDLNATDGDSELLINHFSKNTKISRVGKSIIDNNILRSGSSDTTSSIGLDDGEKKDDFSTYDDIDDFNNTTISYLGKDILVKVKYIEDNATYSDQNITDFSFRYNSSAKNSNIKLITILADMGDYNITLRYPVSNIGASKYLSLGEISR